MATNIQGTPTKGLLLTPAQVTNLPPDQQAAYMRSLSPGEKQLVAQEAANQKVAANRTFLRKAIERYAYCPVSGGSGNTAAYTPGTTLVFDLPVVGGGYAKGLLIRFSINLTFAAGTGATYALNAAAPFNIFSELQLLYNGAQIRTHPYIIKLLDQVAGYGKYPQQNGVPANMENLAFVNNFEGVNAPAAGVLSNTFNGAVTGTTTWVGAMYLPLNAIGTDTVPGLLPVMGVGNKPQLKLICAPAFMGNDPLLNPVFNLAGTGSSVTVNQGASTFVSVDMVYQDGTTMSDPNGVALDLTTEPTLQYYWDTPLNPLNAGLLQRQHIATLLEHWYVFSILIDGQTAGQFAQITASTNNVTSIQLSADSVGQQNFYSFNVANNIPVGDYYDRLVRRVHGQDLDAGVFLWVDAPCRGVLDSDNRNGVQVLNMQPGGYPAATHAYQVTAVGALAPNDGGAKAVPRVETFLISLNYNGLRLT